MYVRTTYSVEKIIFKETKKMSSEFNMTLTEIWRTVKRPFIAKDKNGWLVMIKIDPDIQIKKYRGKIYGKINKDINILFLSFRTRPIDKANYPCWKLFEVIIEDNH